MQHTQIRVPTSADFNFASTVDSNGWQRLAPFSLNRERQVLTRIERLPSQLARLEITHDGDIIVAVQSETTLNDEDLGYLSALITRCFCLDWDLRSCYAKVADDARFRFIKERHLGRVLVAPTMWENLVKTLFLTNTRAQQTTAMAAKFCTLGDPLGAQHAFPTPEQVLAKSVDAIAQQTGTGYRAAYVRDLAAAIAAGFDPESLRNPALSSEEIFDQVMALRGFGSYSASTVLTLLGRFDRISIDSVTRRYFNEITGHDNATDADIEAYYARFGECKGMIAFWDVSNHADAKGDLSF